MTAAIGRWTFFSLPSSSCRKFYRGGFVHRRQWLNASLLPCLSPGRVDAIPAVESWMAFPIGKKSSDGIHQSIPKSKRLTSKFVITLVIANTSTLILPLNAALAETSESSGPFTNINMSLFFAIALVGATVGGLVARQRKQELARLNDQLRQINTALRKQANREEYHTSDSHHAGQGQEAEVVVDPRKEQVLANLRSGKIYLRNQDPEKAFLEFKAGFELADSLGDHTEKKKAARGLGASLQRQGKFREAIVYHSKVLEIAQKDGEHYGSTEAYGAIADCYTELGDLEKAGKFYDKYIARLESD
ncbi:Protein FLUORESCENT IN BLUE LIGHT, chloroplastic [Zostera marina]|uniref:Protein FLUORESCENT IN BLUE LIGHT, chloroplastic n=1 Tax=Zostera marina TaxID=29655 RepID=A0A0K9PBU9_ZOSMR|nr:Protein FLUORESCENT IN BLUE LIGHT, chloroplastic [Zostera marina]